ncbi:NAD(+)/NADH kinase [Natronolimnobius sp. AArcel1]|uniref:NAD(+)/NADH kinase n=1 Tax=Natronolimnobius sp. AArcel1 TaxID=1679093 RepID=UPI0013E9E4AA|nr:NAD(+)/NADH kinase [Natronolimnobius sp. AArcel1]NGM69961.1 NAD(+)/NADH kinase [Natronolimnobius sp. AArcel1]
MDTAWSGRDEVAVGVAASDATSESDHESAVADAVSSATESCPHSLECVYGDLEALQAADLDLVIADGESTLSAVARAGLEVPVLPVGDVDGIDTVAREDVSRALPTIFDGDAREQSQPVLSAAIVDGDGNAVGTERALFDVTLVTDEPARISEFAVRSRGDTVASFRADGVVVSTPAGTHGYASTLEAPQLSAAIDALAVTPIAPFVTKTSRWVLPDDGVRLTVERDEGPIQVVADEHASATISIDGAVTVSVTDTLSTLVVPEDALESHA